MTGGTTARYPEPTPEERSLQQYQAKILAQQAAAAEQQNRMAQALAPILAKEAGLIPQYKYGVEGDVGAGVLTGYEQDPERAAYDAAMREYARMQAEGNVRLLDQQIPLAENQIRLQRDLIPYVLNQAKFQDEMLGPQRELAGLSVDQAKQMAAYQNALIPMALDEQRALAGYQKELIPISLEAARAALPMQQQTLEGNLMAQRAGLELAGQQAAIAQRQADMEARDYDAQRVNLAAQQSNQGLALNRLEAALKGELPVDPGLLSRLDQEQQQLDARFARQLGVGYQTSTPYRQAQDQFDRYRSDTIEAARRADITQATQVQGSLYPTAFRMNQGINTAVPMVGQVPGNQQQPSALNPTVNIPQIAGGVGGATSVPGYTGSTGSLTAMLGGGGGGANPYATTLSSLTGGPGAFGNLSSLFSSAQDQFAAQRQGEYKATLANQQSANEASMNTQKLIGQAMTMAAMAGIAASSKTLKEAIHRRPPEQSMAELRAMPHVNFRYKGEPPQARHTGTIAEQAPAGMRVGGLGISIPDFMGTMHGGIKNLDKRLQTLEMARKG